MNLPDPNDLVARLTFMYGVKLRTRLRPTSSGTVVEIVPLDLHPHEGFAVEVALRWRTIESQFRAGPYAGGLISELGWASLEKRRAAAAFLTSMERDGGKVSILVNGAEVSATAPEEWPTDAWRSLDVSVRRGAIVMDDLSQSELTDALERWGGGVLAVILALARVEEVIDGPVWGLPEGDSRTVLTTRYERSRLNRSACVAAFGPQCQACGFDFGDVYGDDAAGYIHVHHVRPLSELGPGYEVDPTRDLVPVCPNCHAFIHLTTPPRTVAEVREVMNRHRP